MEFIQMLVQPILDMGAAVFLPIVMFIIGLCVGMKPSKAAVSGITLGIAFTGISMVMSFLTGNVGTAAQAFVKNSGFTLPALDLGWAAMLGFTWQWQYAFLMFPIQIGNHIIMIIYEMTQTLNIDV